MTIITQREFDRLNRQKEAVQKTRSEVDWFLDLLREQEEVIDGDMVPKRGQVRLAMAIRALEDLQDELVVSRNAQEDRREAIRQVNDGRVSWSDC